MIPVYTFVEGDTLGLLVLTEADESIASLAERVQAAASLRVVPRSVVTLTYGGRPLRPHETVAQAGIEPLGRLDLRAGGPDDA